MPKTETTTVICDECGKDCGSTERRSYVVLNWGNVPRPRVVGEPHYSVTTGCELGPLYFCGHGCALNRLSAIVRREEKQRLNAIDYPNTCTQSALGTN